MFDFHKLDAYQKAKDLNQTVLRLLRAKGHLDRFLKDQLKRASVSTVINIAEGSGRFSKADKKNFYVISRGSVYECVSLLEIIKDEHYITSNEFKMFYDKYEELSKMLFGLVRSLEK